MPTRGRYGAPSCAAAGLQHGYGAGRGRSPQTGEEARPQTEAANLKRASGRPNSPRCDLSRAANAGIRRFLVCGSRRTRLLIVSPDSLGTAARCQAETHLSPCANFRDRLSRCPHDGAPYLPRVGIRKRCQMSTANWSELRASDVVGRTRPGKLVANLIYDCFFIADAWRISVYPS
jgi:hypothetical protein